MTNVLFIKELYTLRFLLGIVIFLSFDGNVWGQSNKVFPVTFRNTCKNELANDSSLNPIFNRLRQNKTVKVMQIGDSHVKGTDFPRTLKQTLQEHFTNIEFTDYGIYGAWARRFCEDDMIQRIADQHPDLVIISFGTNEAHGNTLDKRGRNAHQETMNQLTQRISECCPGVCFLFTTPPGSYIAHRSYTIKPNGQKRYVVTKVVNKNTENIAKSIVEYCKENHFAVWDIYTIAGGPISASTNWWRAGMMKKDKVHFLPVGYTLLGKLLGEAIWQSYNTFSWEELSTHNWYPSQFYKSRDIQIVQKT